MKIAAIMILALLTGCSTTQALLHDADYTCMTGTIEGRFTSTSFYVRGIRLPEGETINLELAQILCEQ